MRKRGFKSLSATFAGIRPMDVAACVLSQVAGALLSLAISRWPFQPSPASNASHEPQIAHRPVPKSSERGLICGAVVYSDRFLE